MSIDPAYASCHQAMALDEHKYFVMAGEWDLRQPPEQRQYLIPEA